MKGTIVLSHQETHRAKVLERVAAGVLTLRQASVLLGISYRQVKRLKKRYATGGAAALAHRNRGRPAAHALSEGAARQVVALHEQTYSNFNDTHFTEMLEERENITLSRETVRRILRAAGKPSKRRRRPPKHRSRRERRSAVGTMMQWDGSPHRWFGSEHPPCCLMSAIDDADSRLLGAVFVPAESSVGYLHLLDIVLRRHGKPLSVYQDRHTILKRVDDHWSLEEEIAGVRFPTHVGRVLKDLDIRPITAYSPQAKGRVERGFGILQDRLIAELELHGITDIDHANRWLDEVFIDRYNKRFAKTPARSNSAFQKVSSKERYLRIAFAYEATVANDNCVRLGGLIIDIPPGKGRRSYAKAKILVRQHLDGAWTVWYHDAKIAAHPSTKLAEPIRSWKPRTKGDPKGARRIVQIYLASRPAPLP